MCQSEANEFAFEVDDPARCHATTALLQAQRRHDRAQGEDGGEDDSALLWGARFRQ